MLLPQFRLAGPISTDAQRYLGLKNPESCSLSQIDSRLIFVELFSVLCRDCQREAPNINKLYNYIQKDPELEKGIKLIGIGMRSDNKKIQVYKTSFNVKFPLFPDPDNAIFDKLGDPKVPFFMVVNNAGKVLMTHFGPIKDLDEFFGQIKKIYEKR
jgi:peroxiredoxin